jgi:putative nucleotidyltransferase with HDIG domain
MASVTLNSSDSRLVEQVVKIVLNRIASDHLAVPSLPAAAMKCVSLLKSPETPLMQVTAVIETDPVLAAHLLRSANSATFGSGATIRSLDQAVSRLGAQKLRGLVIEASARKLFESPNPRINKATEALWAHSKAVAILARDISAFVGQNESDLAYMAGLLHDIGKPVAAAMLLEAERAIAGGKQNAKWIEPDAWIVAVQQCHRTIGSALTKKWNLSEVVQRTVDESNEYDSSDRISVPNIVAFANAAAKRGGLYIGSFETADVDALLLIGRSMLGIEEEMLERLMAGLAERVQLG